MRRSLAVAFAFLLLGTLNVLADTVTIRGSGRDNTGAALAGGSLDPHYTITAYNGTTLASPLATYVVDAGGLYPYTIAAADSLSPNVLGNGDYTYTTTFDLTGLDASTAELTGIWGGDDSPGGVLLNGTAVSAPTTYPSGCCYFQGSLDITSGFVDGTNTISFVIDQTDNWYDYARIGDLTVTASPISGTSSVPEPASMTLLGTGLLAAVGRMRSKRR